MNRAKYKLLLVGLIVLMAVKNHFSLRGLLDKREEYGLTRLAEPLEDMPPALAFTTVALGGFRGLITNYLWFRATSLQYKGRYFETLSLANWITKLQPTFAAVWEQQAFNMVYNISREFSEPQERWLWIRSGITLLRDEGIPYNPETPLLYRELAFIFQDKLGGTLDDDHMYYKIQWASEMVKALGGNSVNWDELLNPTTDEWRERVRELRETYKLDPAFMKRVNDEYGPLDWRLPESHAVYWAALGLERCHQENLIILRRVIWQSMQLTFQRGRLLINPTDQTIDFAPNLTVIPKVNHAYELMMQEQPDQKEYIGRGQRNFLIDAVYLLYLHQRYADAQKYYQYLQDNYAAFLKPNQSLEDFVVDHVTDRTREDALETSLAKTRAVIYGLLSSAYYYAAIDESDLANNYGALAKRIHDRYQRLVKGQESRLFLAPMDDLKAYVVNEALAGKDVRFNPQMAARLRTLLQLGKDETVPVPFKNAGQPK